MVVKEIYGKMVNLDIPEDVFPTMDEMNAIDAYLPGCQHGWYKSVSKIDKGGDNIDLHYRYWLPKNNTKPKGIVIYTHGIHSHSGHGCRLDDGRALDVPLIVETFTKMGFAVYARDMYGHGFSEGTRFFLPSWKECLEDIINFCNLVSDENPKDIPLFLSGESIGGNFAVLASRYFQDNPDKAPSNFDSCLLICPAIEGDLPPFPVYQILRYILAPMYPKWRPFFMPNPISPERIWRDKKACTIYTNPRKQEMQIDACGIPFRLGTAVNMVLALEEVQNEAIPGYKMPFCIVHGDSDEGVPISGSKRLFDGCSTPDDQKEFHIIESGYHGLMADPNAEVAIGHLARFAEKRMKKFKAS